MSASTSLAPGGGRTLLLFAGLCGSPWCSETGPHEHWCCDYCAMPDPRPEGQRTPEVNPHGYSRDDLRRWLSRWSPLSGENACDRCARAFFGAREVVLIDRDEPVRCHAGHLTVLALWNCPACTDIIADDLGDLRSIARRVARAAAGTTIPLPLRQAIEELGFAAGADPLLRIRREAAFWDTVPLGDRWRP